MMHITFGRTFVKFPVGLALTTTRKSLPKEVVKKLGEEVKRKFSNFLFASASRNLINNNIIIKQ